MSFLSRWSETILKLSLNTHRVICVVGCRQSGKTTLVKHNCPISAEFKTLDSDATLVSAKDDPSFFIRRRPNTSLIIDEIQKAPALIGEIKIAVDDDPTKGQYIITGSADYRKLPQAKESLAGRVGFVRVRTFTEAELRKVPVGFLANLFDEAIPYSCSKSDCNKPLILSLAENGGFFEPQTLNLDERAHWYQSYIDQQIILDMRNQWGIKRKDTVAELFKYLAAFSSKPFVTRALSQQLNVAWATVEGYVSSIEAMYLVDMVPAWTKKDYDRPGQTPKLFMTDTGLMSALLDISNAADKAGDQEFAQNFGGKLVETWAYNQLIAEVDLHPRWTLYHLRTKIHEIDFLITNENNSYLAIDIKSGESVNSEDFRHIRWFQQLEGKENCIGVVLYAGNEVRSFGDRCYAIPLACLWLGR